MRYYIYISESNISAILKEDGYVIPNYKSPIIQLNDIIKDNKIIDQEKYNNLMFNLVQNAYADYDIDEIELILQAELFKEVEVKIVPNTNAIEHPNYLLSEAKKQLEITSDSKTQYYVSGIAYEEEAKAEVTIIEKKVYDSYLEPFLKHKNKIKRINVSNVKDKVLEYFREVENINLDEENIMCVIMHDHYFNMNLYKGAKLIKPYQLDYESTNTLKDTHTVNAETSKYIKYVSKTENIKIDKFLLIPLTSKNQNVVEYQKDYTSTEKIDFIIPEIHSKIGISTLKYIETISICSGLHDNKVNYFVPIMEKKYAKIQRVFRESAIILTAIFFFITFGLIPALDSKALNENLIQNLSIEKNRNTSLVAQVNSENSVVVDKEETKEEQLKKEIYLSAYELTKAKNYFITHYVDEIVEAAKLANVEIKSILINELDIKITYKAKEEYDALRMKDAVDYIVSSKEKLEGVYSDGETSTISYSIKQVAENIEEGQENVEENGGTK